MEVLNVDDAKLRPAGLFDGSLWSVRSNRCRIALGEAALVKIRVEQGPRSRALPSYMKDMGFGSGK
jgi:hypothetical protein